MEKSKAEWAKFFEQNDPCSKAAAYAVMRALRPLVPADTYYENYLAMRKKYEPNFYDIYQLIWLIGSQLAPKRILEIGTRSGISLCQLLSSYIDLGTVEFIVTIDLFEHWLKPEIVIANLNHLNLSCPAPCHIVRGRSDEVLPKLLEQKKLFDYILVDGCHEAAVAMKDLEMSHPLCAPGGIVLFDDISKNPGECGLVTVWNAFKTAHADEYHFFERLEGKGVAWAVQRG